MVKRRSLTPETGSLEGDVHATRRGGGGARREVAGRVVLRDGRKELAGWALNISRGGIRLILEEKVELGQAWDVEIPEDATVRTRKGRVVWVQEEPDGMIVGIEFTVSAPPGPNESESSSEA